MSRIIIVGAGAVGLVYGRHLQMGGDEVHFLVRPKYAEATRQGVDVYHLNKGKKAPPVRFEGYGVLTSLEEVAAQSWDQLWLCVSSTALQGDWLKETIAAVGPDATVVGMQPGAADKDRVSRFCPPERLVWGLITLMSYQTPLPGEDRVPGLAYWFPPLSPKPLDGTRERGVAVAKALKRGGCPARYSPAVMARVGLAAATFVPLIAGLEGAGWSFSDYKTDPVLGVAHGASREAIEAVARRDGVSVPLAVRMVRPWMIKVALGVAPWVVPLPIEVFLKYHFTKVGEQTRSMLREYEALGKAADLPVSNLEALCGRLLSAPGEDGATGL